MLAARLHGPADLRVETIAPPDPVGAGEVLVRVKATGICGSDLHSYKHARIGDTVLKSPLTLGHEFAGVVEKVGPDSEDGLFQPIPAGTRVAVDPAQPCGRCEPCAQGNPNLCRRIHFCGLYPDEGSLAEWIKVPACTCFPVSDKIDYVTAALLEPLGVAIHAVDLAHLRVANSVAILGAGAIGLLILQVAKLAGADPIFVTDKLPWRLDVAKRFGGIAIDIAKDDPVDVVDKATRGRGVDAAIEAAWADTTIQNAADMARPGGRLVLVGVPDDDRVQIVHSTFRRKGLTIMMARRMKHVYPRAIQLVERGGLDLRGIVSHRFPLEKATEAFKLNANYEDRVVKVVIGTELEKK